MAIANLHNAAVLLLSLPKQQAAELFDCLEPDQAAAVTAEMGRLKEIDATEGEAVAREFAAASATSAADRQPAEAVPFEFLCDFDSEDLLPLIAGEHPQIIALILSYLPPEQAADLLAGLSVDEQLAIVCRIAEMAEPSPEVIRDVEEGLRSCLSGGSDRPVGKRGVASVVRMLNVMEPAIERKLLGELAEAEPELEREIRRAMFGVDVAARREPDMTEAAC
jgi:flagellar motor switch protein FliG